MKKGFIIGGSIFLALAVAFMLFFVFAGDSFVKDPVDMTGTWKVVSYSINGSYSEIIDNEFMVFDAETVTDYRDGKEFAASSYTLKGLTLKAPELGKEYEIELISEGIVRLCSGGGEYINLVYWTTGDINKEPAPVVFSGRWDLAHRDSENFVPGTYFIFGDKTLEYYANSNAEPVTMNFTQSGNVLTVNELSLSLEAYTIRENYVVLVDQDGWVWAFSENSAQ